MKATNITVEQLVPASAHLATVKTLWRQHSKTLGFFPDEAFNDYAHSRHVLAAIQSDRCVGYLLYRINRDNKVVVVHLCVDPGARRQGVAHALVDRLRELTKEQVGVFLKCRQDYQANATWPRLGFANVGESQGKASGGSVLIHWWLDYGHPSLFDEQETVGKLDAAIDANIFLDLMEERNEESLGLAADWLAESVTLCYTPELLNEVGRSDDRTTRFKRRAEAEQFKLLRCTPDQFQHAEAVLKPLFPELPTLRDESDFRHLVRASASGANVFVTRDGPLLDQADAVFDASGLAIVRPAEFIGQLDTLVKEKEYQRRFVAGTKQVSRTRLSQADANLVATLRRPHESLKGLVARLNCCLADPTRYECHCVTDAADQPLALYVVESTDRGLSVPLLRVAATRQADTLVRYLLKGFVRRAVDTEAAAVFVADSELVDSVAAACSELGFLPVEGGRVKLVLSGLLTAADAATRLAWEGPRIDQLRQTLGQASSSASTASVVEHLLWPAKLIDSALPCFIAPIKPRFAEQLFDEKLADAGLFGADVDLALNPESAYYRSAKPAVVTCPSRVLWYVSGDRAYSGSKAIRGCSRIVELATDSPKRLYKRFRRLGVYSWEDVSATAGDDLNRDIMAFRFDDSETLSPIPWSRFQPILRSHGVKTQLQSPCRIPSEAFADIYALAFHPSQVR